IAVMNEGRIVQIGAPKEIYGRPASEFVANFIGRTNLLRGVLSRDAPAESIAPVSTDMGELLCFFPNASVTGTKISLVIRPEHIAIRKVNGVEPREHDVNRLAGHVMREIYLGEIIEYLVQVGGGEVLVRTPLGSVGKGDAVILSFAAEHTVAL